MRDGVGWRGKWGRDGGIEERRRLTRHQRVPEVVLAVLVALDVLPFEVGAAAAVETPTD